LPGGLLDPRIVVKANTSRITTTFNLDADTFFGQR
jgi:hypothetical protein